jgi:hypothetical protein
MWDARSPDRPQGGAAPELIHQGIHTLQTNVQLFYLAAFVLFKVKIRTPHVTWRHSNSIIEP